MLNKAKKFKQLDLKSSIVHKDSGIPLSIEELTVLKKHMEEERDRRLLLKETEKQRKKEARLRKLRETQELKRKERLEKEEWLKPREDTLCEDSKVGVSLYWLCAITYSVCIVL